MTLKAAFSPKRGNHCLCHTREIETAASKSPKVLRMAEVLGMQLNSSTKLKPKTIMRTSSFILRHTPSKSESTAMSCAQWQQCAVSALGDAEAGLAQAQG